MTIGTVTEKKQPDNKYVDGDEVIRIKELRVHLSFEFQVGDSNQNTKLIDVLCRQQIKLF